MSESPEHDDPGPGLGSAPRADVLAAARAGVRDAAPMLIGIVPFGLVAGASPVDAGLGITHAVGMSVLLFAGASQLAMTEVLADGGGVAVAVATALTINLRMLLYSASLAPMVAGERLGARLRVGYLLVDQAYALSVVRWTGDDDRRLRMPYYLAVGSLLWTSWQVTTIVGALAGGRVPESIPLDFAAPLVFLVLLVPAVSSRPAVVAAIFGGSAAVLAGELGAARVAVLVGGLVGIAAGTLADRDDPMRNSSPEPQPPSGRVR